METNIVVLDCQKMFVEGLDAYFSIHAKSFKITSQVCSAEDLKTTTEKDKFDILIMELNIPDHDGLSLIQDMRKEIPEIKILVLSSYTDSKLVRNAMINGADGYVAKKSTFRELLFGLEEIIEGHTYIGDGLRTSPAAYKKKENPVEVKREYNDTFTLKQKLTKREQEILELITQGKSNKHIGKELYISFQTVGVHRKNIMKKLGIRNTVSLIKFALENHLV
ncbi:MAG: response regulator transcription factor [Saprospiraceae bacterium]|nr:response regulator transcription factor [Saprospiraceae bacterium]